MAHGEHGNSPIRSRDLVKDSIITDTNSKSASLQFLDTAWKGILRQPFELLCDALQKVVWKSGQLAFRRTTKVDSPSHCKRPLRFISDTKSASGLVGSDRLVRKTM